MNNSEYYFKLKSLIITDNPNTVIDSLFDCLTEKQELNIFNEYIQQFHDGEIPENLDYFDSYDALDIFIDEAHKLGVTNRHVVDIVKSKWINREYSNIISFSKFIEIEPTYLNGKPEMAFHDPLSIMLSFYYDYVTDALARDLFEIVKEFNSDDYYHPCFYDFQNYDTLIRLYRYHDLKRAHHILNVESASKHLRVVPLNIDAITILLKFDGDNIIKHEMDKGLDTFINSGEDFKFYRMKNTVQYYCDERTFLKFKLINHDSLYLINHSSYNWRQDSVVVGNRNIIRLTAISSQIAIWDLPYDTQFIN